MRVLLVEDGKLNETPIAGVPEVDSASQAGLFDVVPHPEYARNGWIYFAGRTGDWLRVDGENLATAPIERILLRHPAVCEASVYALPDRIGDKVACALVLRGPLAADELWSFLREQPDLSPKAWPSVVRILEELPRTATNKVLKRSLRDLPTELGTIWERSR